MAAPWHHPRGPSGKEPRLGFPPALTCSLLATWLWWHPVAGAPQGLLEPSRQRWQWQCGVWVEFPRWVSSQPAPSGAEREDSSPSSRAEPSRAGPGLPHAAANASAALGQAGKSRFRSAGSCGSRGAGAQHPPGHVPWLWRFSGCERGQEMGGEPEKQGGGVRSCERGTGTGKGWGGSWERGVPTSRVLLDAREAGLPFPAPCAGAALGWGTVRPQLALGGASLPK